MISVNCVADSFVIIVDSVEDVEAFKQLVQRAAMTWTDAPVCIKEFADEITNGKHMQNYRFLANEPAKGEPRGK